MKKTILLCSIALLSACSPNYSNGERSGVITKVSVKGIIFKSIEAEMLMVVPGGVLPEKFSFTVSDKAVVKVRDAVKSGKQVQVVYNQWLIAPPTIDTPYVVVDVLSQ